MAKDGLENISGGTVKSIVFFREPFFSPLISRETEKKESGRHLGGIWGLRWPWEASWRMKSLLYCKTHGFCNNTLLTCEQILFCQGGTVKSIVSRWADLCSQRVEKQEG